MEDDEEDGRAKVLREKEKKMKADKKSGKLPIKKKVKHKRRFKPSPFQLTRKTPEPSGFEGDENVVIVKKSKGCQFVLRNASFSCLEPTPRKAAEEQKVSWYLKAVEACRTMYDFSHPTFQMDEKKAKVQCMHRILSFIQTSPDLLSTTMAIKTMRMTSRHLFRDLPYIPYGSDPLEIAPNEDAVEEPAWTHIEIAYHMLKCLLQTPHKIPKGSVDRQLVWLLCYNFRSADDRERSYLKTVIHGIYHRYPRVRIHTLCAIGSNLIEVVEDNTWLGVQEQLVLLHPIIAGFATPLAHHNLLLFRMVILRLYKAKYSIVFLEQLTVCVLSFITKKKDLASEALKAVMKAWPWPSASKQLKYFETFMSICNATTPEIFAILHVRFFYHISLMVQSPLHLVAERAFQLFNDPYFAELALAYPKKFVEIFKPKVLDASVNHWNPTIREHAKEVLDLFKKIKKELGTIDKDVKKEGKARAYTVEEMQKENKISAFTAAQYSVSTSSRTSSVASIATPVSGSTRSTGTADVSSEGAPLNKKSFSRTILHKFTKKKDNDKKDKTKKKKKAKFKETSSKGDVGAEEPKSAKKKSEKAKKSGSKSSIKLDKAASKQSVDEQKTKKGKKKSKEDEKEKQNASDSESKTEPKKKAKSQRSEIGNANSVKSQSQKNGSQRDAGKGLDQAASLQNIDEIEPDAKSHTRKLDSSKITPPQSGSKSKNRKSAQEPL